MRFSGNFPENFREISGEIFHEFSTFRKLPRNFPGVFLDFPYFYTIEKIDFRSVPVGLHVKVTRNFPGSFRNSRNFRKISQEKTSTIFTKYLPIVLLYILYVR